MRRTSRQIHHQKVCSDDALRDSSESPGLQAATQAANPMCAAVALRCRPSRVPARSAIEFGQIVKSCKACRRGTPFISKWPTSSGQLLMPQRLLVASTFWWGWRASRTPVLWQRAGHGRAGRLNGGVAAAHGEKGQKGESDREAW